jgi:hypothetical protein
MLAMPAEYARSAVGTIRSLATRGTRSARSPATTWPARSSCNANGPCSRSRHRCTLGRITRDHEPIDAASNGLGLLRAVEYPTAR